MVMMGRSFESWFLQATDAALVSDASARPIVTVGIKKISRGGRVAGFPGFYLKELDTISPAMGALSAAPPPEGLGRACVAANLFTVSGQSTASGQTIRLEKVPDYTG